MSCQVQVHLHAEHQLITCWSAAMIKQFAAVMLQGNAAGHCHQMEQYGSHMRSTYVGLIHAKTQMHTCTDHVYDDSSSC